MNLVRRDVRVLDIASAAKVAVTEEVAKKGATTRIWYG